MADDDIACLRIVENTFRLRGFSTIGFMDGRTAWASIQQHPCLKWVVLNWMLPELDGYRIARRLQEQTQFLHIAVMIGKALLPEVYAKLDLHCHYVLVKPFERPDFDRQIDAMVQMSLRGRTLAGMD